MEHLNCGRLLGLWQAEGNAVVKPCSLPDTQWILESILGDVPQANVSLDQNAVSRLIDELFEWRQANERAITYRQARKRVNRVLEQFNSIPSMEAVLIPEPIQAHRPGALPPTGRALALSQQMMQLDRRLLDWSRRTSCPDAWLFVLGIRLMTRLGMGERVLLGTLAMLTRQHVSECWLAIPSAQGERLSDGGHYRMRLPDDVWIPLRAMLTQAKHKPASAWLLAETEPEQALDHSDRVKGLRRRLKRAATRFLKETNPADDNNGRNGLRNWSALVSASQYVPVLRGIPALWARMLRQYPLPTCTPVPLLIDSGKAHQYAPGQQFGRLPDRAVSRCVSPVLPEIGSQTQPAGVSMLDTEHLPPDWSRRIKNILQQFLAEARRLGKDKVNISRFKKPMQQMLEHYEAQIVQLIGHSGSYPQWVLNFLYHQLCTTGHKLSTASTNLSRLTPISLMLNEAVLDLSDWDDDVVIELQEAATSGSGWADRTREAFFASLRQFFSFCQGYGQLEGVSLPRSGTSSLAPSVLRTRILSPDHAQTVWHALIDKTPDGDPRQMVGLVIALGFYGGLRASEVLSLTLNNVLIGTADEQGDSFCWIEILGGKTSAARRRVALHVMAPPSVIQQMQGWVTSRRSECPGCSLAETALFGPRHSPRAFTRDSLITPAIAWMRYVLGEDIDFHGLRHAAVSWTLLRLHAAQRPVFGAQLQHYHHWMFSDSSLQSTLEHFCGAEGQDTLTRGTLLLQVAKWIGHRDPRTLLETYAHTLGLIHSEILEPT